MAILAMLIFLSLNTLMQIVLLFLYYLLILPIDYSPLMLVFSLP